MILSSRAVIEEKIRDIVGATIWKAEGDIVMGYLEIHRNSRNSTPTQYSYQSSLDVLITLGNYFGNRGESNPTYGPVLKKLKDMEREMGLEKIPGQPLTFVIGCNLPSKDILKLPKDPFVDETILDEFPSIKGE